MNSLSRLLAGVLVMLGLGLAAAPSQAISVVGSLGWQPVPQVCNNATNVRYTVSDRKVRFQCGVAQFACTPAGSVAYSVMNQRVTVACASNTVDGIAGTRTRVVGGQVINCSSLQDFNFNAHDGTVSFVCPSLTTQVMTCYPSDVTTMPPPEPGTPNGSLPIPDYVNGLVNLGYCPDAYLELLGRNGFEDGEGWRPIFGQQP